MPYKNLKRSSETLDFGNQLRFTVAIMRQDEPLMRNAVLVPTGPEVMQQAEYELPTKVYITSTRDLPLEVVGSDYFEDDPYEELGEDYDGPFAVPLLYKDKQGLYYLEPGKLLKPAVTRPRQVGELEKFAREQLDDWVEAVHEAGLELEKNKE